jgi:hypothetical protein
MRARTFVPLTTRELLLAMAIVTVFVGAFINCQIVRKSLAATNRISAALPGPEK